MFQFPQWAFPAYVLSWELPGFARQGFPIRRSTGSLLSSKPWLIAGSYVLHRLSVPRHPPHALTSLAKKPYSNLTRAASKRGTGASELVRILQALLKCFALVTLAFNCQRSKHSSIRRMRKTTFVRASGPRLLGGDERDRTVGLRLAKPALSQLSYIPKGGAPSPGVTRCSLSLVGPSRIELPTSRLSGVRSNQLSYGPTPDRRACSAARGSSGVPIAL